MNHATIKNMRTCVPLNRDDTLEILREDEGVFCHLLNKISYLVATEQIPREDYLEIVNLSMLTDVPVIAEVLDADFSNKSRPYISAVLNYSMTVLGY